MISSPDVQDILLVVIEEMNEEDLRRIIDRLLGQYENHRQDVYDVLCLFKKQLSELTGTIHTI